MTLSKLVVVAAALVATSFANAQPAAADKSSASSAVDATIAAPASPASPGAVIDLSTTAPTLPASDPNLQNREVGVRGDVLKEMQKANPTRTEAELKSGKPMTSRDGKAGSDTDKK